MGLYGQRERKVQAERCKLPCPLCACVLSDSHFIFKNEIISSKRAFSTIEEGKSNCRRAWERAGEWASYDFGYGFA